MITWSVITMEVGQTGPHFLPLNTTINGPLYPDVMGGLYINYVTMTFKDDHTSWVVGVTTPRNISHHKGERQDI